MPKNKRDQRNNPDVDEQEEEGNELDEQENEPGERALSTEPWIKRNVDVDDAPTAYVQGNWKNNEGFPLSDDTVSDFIEVGSDPDAVTEEIQRHTLDIEVQEDFEERQNMSTDSDSLEEELVENTHQSPKLSGGDVDAAWNYSDQSGEESVGASVPTPDQDVVDELGEAFGITYDDDEELDTEEKLGERDLHRWELNPASARDMETGLISDRPEGSVSFLDEDEQLLDDELEDLLDDEDLDDLEDELRDADLDPLDLDDEDLDDFDDEDLELIDGDELDELDEEDIS